MTLARLSRLSALLLIAALFINNVAFAAKKSVDPAAMKAKVQARGVGQGVRVTLADNTEAKGLIVNIGEQSFVVKPKGADQPREIQYAQLTGVHNDKLTTGQKVGIWVAIGAAAIVITAIVIDHMFRSSFPKTIPI
jgi:hypothetical protein